MKENESSKGDTLVVIRSMVDLYSNDLFFRSLMIFYIAFL